MKSFAEDGRFIGGIPDLQNEVRDKGKLKPVDEGSNNPKGSQRMRKSVVQKPITPSAVRLGINFGGMGKSR